MQNPPEILLELPAKAVQTLGTLLGSGFKLASPIGISLQKMLRDRLGLDDDYITERLQTVFINGRAVDRFDQAILADGDTIALSAAMPGLVGATFRKGGCLAPLRAGISQETSRKASRIQEGAVILKLFNVVAAEIGPSILEAGVQVHPRDLDLFLSRLTDKGQLPAGAVTCDGLQITPENLDVLLRRDATWIGLRVKWRQDQFSL